MEYGRADRAFVADVQQRIAEGFRLLARVETRTAELRQTFALLQGRVGGLVAIANGKSVRTRHA